MRVLRALCRLLSVVAVAVSAPLVAQEKHIAFTFDDAPRAAGALFSEDARALRIIAALHDGEVEQAAFFVNPGNIAERRGSSARLSAYVAAGHVIANHTWSHPRLGDVSAEEYIADIDRASSWLSGREGYRPWFRFPYLDEGADDKAKRDAVRTALGERGLTNGYVTVEAIDWFYDGELSKAVRADAEVDMPALQALFIESHIDAANFYDGLAREALGCSPAHVLLLHESDLVAQVLPNLIAAFRADGWTIVTADEAYRDPIANEHPDVEVSQGTLTEMIAWERGLPAPRWYEGNNTSLASQWFRERVLGETTENAE